MCVDYVAWHIDFVLSPSAEAVAMSWPLKSKHTSSTSSLCPTRVATHFPLAASHNCKFVHRTLSDIINLTHSKQPHAWQTVVWHSNMQLLTVFKWLHFNQVPGGTQWSGSFVTHLGMIKQLGINFKREVERGKWGRVGINDKSNPSWIGISC